jgi:hypothetical protein
VSRVQELQEIESLSASGFSEPREAYACSWCEVDRGQLLIIPHPESQREVRRYDYPSQADIVGRMTAITMWIVGERTAESHGSKESDVYPLRQLAVSLHFRR